MARCACGNPRPERKCCGPILLGKRVADGPESLVRARYTAFTRGDLEFLLNSCHPQTMCRFDPEVNRTWAAESEWHGLEILATRDGPVDGSSTVEFKAYYTSDGIRRVHHEISELRRLDGKWVFFDGAPPHE